MNFSAQVLELDMPSEVERICTAIRATVLRDFRRRGVVVGLSGGIDSSVCAALAVRALGAKRVLGLHMPEGESAAESLDLSQLLARHLGVPSVVENITPMLQSANCYARRDACLRQVLPAYGAGWRCKIVLPSLSQAQQYRIFSVVAQSPDGQIHKVRMPPEVYLGVVAASNFKQRVRKMLEYYHADRLHFAVVGTPNRLEYDQGFFVKNGDGAADLKPIAHLYKSQVYALAQFLDIPAEIRARPPSTDTYSLPQGQDEFYFSLPYPQMDLCLYGRTHGVAPREVAQAVGLQTEQVERVFRDIDAKRSAARYLHMRPVVLAANSL